MSPAGYTTRQHVISLMLQKRFTDGDGLLWFWDARRGLSDTRVNPINLFVEKHVYSTVAWDGTKDDALEKMFSLLEGAASPVFDKLIEAARRQRFPPLTPYEIEVVMDFIICQLRRSPDFFRTFEPPALGLDTLLAEAEGDGEVVTDEIRRMFAGPANEARIQQNILRAAIGTLSGVDHAAMRKRGLRLLLLTRPDRSFILGSFPFARFGDPKGNHLGNPDAELWMPIAPNVLLGSMGPPKQGAIVLTDKDQAIRKVNAAIAMQSTVVASASKALVASLTRHRELRPKTSP